MAKRGSVFDWNDTLFRFGVYASIGWIGCAFLFLWLFANWTEKPKPNEWGDIFAGVAAPMAFLWLVLGFLQQGRELKLQIQEVRNTVRHQAELAEAARDQVSLQRRQEMLDRMQREAAAQPRFVLAFAGSTGGSQGREYKVAVTNGGAIATSVHVSVEPTPQTGSEHFIPTISAQDTDEFVFRFVPAPISNFSILIRFTDALGNDGRTLFTAIIDGTGLRFVRTTT